MCVPTIPAETPTKEENPLHPSREEHAERIVIRVWETVIREKKIGNGEADNAEKFKTLVKEVENELQKIEEENGTVQNSASASRPPFEGWPQQEPGMDY